MGSEETEIVVASNAYVIQMRKTIHSAFTERMVFLLVEALPQAPVNAVFQSAAARFWESLLFESAVRQRGLVLYLFTLTDIG